MKPCWDGFDLPGLSAEQSLQYLQQANSTGAIRSWRVDVSEARGECDRIADTCSDRCLIHSPTSSLLTSITQEK